MIKNVLKYSNRISCSSFSYFKRLFSEVVPTSEVKAATTIIKKPIEVLTETSKLNLGFTQEEISLAIKTGSDLHLTGEKI